MEVAFAILVLLIAYVFLLYPGLMTLIGHVPAGRAWTPFTPHVAVLVAARNEQDCIRDKIANTLAAAYPPDCLTVWVGSDGSGDDTNAVVKECHDPRVSLVPFPEGPGKTAVINGLAALADAEILVISDADVLIDTDALRALTRHFSDPRVGAVCARRSDRSTRAGGVGRQARLYNTYEGAVKRGEGRLGRVLGGNGSLYALRRSLFVPLPADVPDDFVGILRVIRQGYRVRYEDDAVSWEELPVSAGEEFARRRRTIARGIRGLWAVRGLLNPFRYPCTAFLLFSHKILRWLAGFVLIALLALNVMLLPRPFFAACLIAQVLFYLVPFLLAPSSLSPLLRPLRLARYFVLLNLAAVAGVIDVLRRRDWRSWEVVRPQGACL